MIGEALLRYPRLHALLRRRGVVLTETSVALPHLILDHESGVLVLDEATLRQPGQVVAMVGRCEAAYRTLWLLVLCSNGSTDKLWAHVRLLLAELCASPLKLPVRVVHSTECWPTIHHILSHRAADPLDDALADGTDDDLIKLEAKPKLAI